MSKEMGSAQLALLFLSFWLVFLFLMSFQKPVDQLLTNDRLAGLRLTEPDPLRPKSEYRVNEHISKYYLLILMIVSIIAYSSSSTQQDMKQSICFFLLGLSMYLSESNVLPNDAQPLYGCAILSFILYLLLKTRAWLVVLLLVTGFIAMGLGAVNDRIHDNENLLTELPAIVVKLAHLCHEETFEALGGGCVLLSALVCFFNLIEGFIKGHIKACAWILVFAGMIAVGRTRVQS